MSPVNLDIRVAELVTRGTRAARNLLTTVLDASATVEYLLGTSRAITFRQAVRSLASLHIPALCDVEVASSLRRLLLQGSLREDRAKEALRDYLDLPLIRHGHSTLLGRVLSLRSSFSAYDATYIALAERLGATLVTGDEVLARAVESHLEIETMLI
jgi:predicted nucleic acid-binding protein